MIVASRWNLRQSASTLTGLVNALVGLMSKCVSPTTACPMPCEQWSMRK